METSTCRSCAASIVWLKTAAGKPIPVNAHTVRALDKVFSPGIGHINHFLSCPNAQQHRVKTQRDHARAETTP